MISWNLKNQGHQPIGLDIGHSSIKMIQLAVHGGHRSVVAAEKVQIPAEVNDDAEKKRDFIAESIKQMAEKGGFYGREVISCLANDELKIISVRLSETEQDEIEQVLKKEAAQRFGLKDAEDVINYLTAGEVKQGDEIKNELIVFAADKATIRNHIELLESAGLRPAGIDTVACALFRNFCCQLQRQEDKEHSAVFVDIGEMFTTVVFSRGEEVSFVKQIPIGVEKFNRQIASRLGVDIEQAGKLRHRLRSEKVASEVLAGSDGGSGWVPKADESALGSGFAPAGDLAGQSSLDGSTRQIIVDSISLVAEELAKEISLCFRYYTVTFRGMRVERAVFSGGGAYEDILLNILRQRLAVEVQVAEPLKGFDMMNVDLDGDRRSLLCEWTVAVGIGLKGI